MQEEDHQDKIENIDEIPQIQQHLTKQKITEKQEQDELEAGVRFSDLHPVEEKVIKSGSLEFDIKLGWMPRAQITGPIPLAFAHPDMDDLISEHIDPASFVYFGYRPTNTFDIHKNFYQNGQKYPFNQFHLCKSKFLERFFRKHYSDFQFDAKKQPGMVKGKVGDQSPLIFDSFFQGGNLDFVYKHQGEYRLGIRPDTNTRGHCLYYYFKIKCLKPGKYYFRIVNMSKPKSLYERGLRPYIRTKKKNQWHQAGQGIRYGKSPLYEEYDLTRPMYSLKFNFTFQEDDDEVEFCYGIPYLYSDLLSYIDLLRKIPGCYVNKLCYTLSGVEIPLLTITDNKQSNQEEDKDQDNNKKIIIITGRVHPSETHGSHIINGFIEALLKDTPEAILLRNNIIFKIIPMINPDGVIIGNTRTSFAGKDLNRVYSEKTDFVFPEVIGIRDFTKKLKQKYGKRLLFFIDVHGHSTRKNSFFFGPQYPVFDQQYTKCRLLPKIFSNKTEVFRYYSCKFRISSQKQKTCRGYFNGKNIVRTYTHETSIHSFFDFGIRGDRAFDKRSLAQLGMNMMLAIHDFVKITVKLVEIQIPQPEDKKKKRKKIPEDDQPQQQDSDDMESGGADSEDSADDFGRNHMQQFFHRINENKQYFYEELMSFNGFSNPKQAKKDKKKQMKEITEAEETNKEQKSGQQIEMITFSRDLGSPDNKQKKKIDWTAKYEFIPKKKQFLEYERLSSVVFGSSETYLPSFQTTLNIKLAANNVKKKSKYSLVNLVPSTEVKKEENKYFSEKTDPQLKRDFKRTTNNMKFQQTSRKSQEFHHFRSEEKQLFTDTKIIKKKQLYDLQTLDKLVNTHKSPNILAQYQSKNYLFKQERTSPVKDKLRTTSLKIKILPRKKSIKNLRQDDGFQRRKTLKNMRDTGLTSKLPSLDKLVKRF